MFWEILNITAFWLALVIGVLLIATYLIGWDKNRRAGNPRPAFWSRTRILLSVLVAILAATAIFASTRIEEGEGPVVKMIKVEMVEPKPNSTVPEAKKIVFEFSDKVKEKVEVLVEMEKKKIAGQLKMVKKDRLQWVPDKKLSDGIYTVSVGGENIVASSFSFTLKAEEPEKPTEPTEPDPLDRYRDKTRKPSKDPLERYRTKK